MYFLEIAFGGRSYGTSDYSAEAPIPPRRSGISGRRGPFALGRKGGPAGPRGKTLEKPSRPKKPAKKPVLVRSDFPETWIWTEDRIKYEWCHFVLFDVQASDPLVYCCGLLPRAHALDRGLGCCLGWIVSKWLKTTNMNGKWYGKISRLYLPCMKWKRL